MMRSMIQLLVVCGEEQCRMKCVYGLFRVMAQGTGGRLTLEMVILTCISCGISQTSGPLWSSCGSV